MTLTLQRGNWLLSTACASATPAVAGSLSPERTWSGTLSYTGETAAGATWRVSLNVQNLFDKGPDQVPNVSTSFAIQGLTGDLYGRRHNLNFNYSF